MKRNDFLVAEINNTMSVLLQVQEQLHIYDDYTENELRLLMSFVEQKKEQCKEVKVFASIQCDLNTNDKYQHIYDDIHNSVVGTFRNVYLLACDLFAELGERLRKLKNSSNV